MLMKLSKWREARFPEGQAPDVRTCRREIDLGTLPGKRIGRTYYVDVEKEKQVTGDILLDELLQH
ncbi:hypothetical protein [Vibrio mangrovi]|uniref:Uncharacterized protein n=1 Tax=Vibrio mangrovi TaxID=474394 RepID=A0A1Y6IY71_9VIBR|nr:hypothetical protein [Vibrio mangrovi]MDW6004702.1 hypothetical protein [Vibrio mangrovi]SMS00993.1 hypothetical protein VIM7927_02270 [Vibrio mangrovi]